MKSFSYSRKAEVGKAYVLMKRNWYIVHIYDTVDAVNSSSSKAPAPNEFRELYEASARAAELNDWQRLGTKGHEVYKGHAIFNKAFKVEPWEHIYLSDDKIFFFTWDTREITKVAKRPSVDIMPYLYIEKTDNHKPICLNGKWLNYSTLLKQPINFKTDKQMASNEDDMAICNSDNSSLAADVDTVHSADTQQELGLAVSKLMFNGIEIAKGNPDMLRKQFNIDNKMKLRQTIRLGTVTIPAGTVLQFSNEGIVTYKGKTIAKSAIETIALKRDAKSTDDSITERSDFVIFPISNLVNAEHINRLSQQGIHIHDCTATSTKNLLTIAMPDTIKQALAVVKFMTECGYDASDIVNIAPEIADMAKLDMSELSKQNVAYSITGGLRSDRPLI